LSEKRHRLHSHEIPEIVEGLRLRLRELLEKREEPERAEIAFRTMIRMEWEFAGRPKYPEFSWANLQKYLDRYARRLS
jgi:hypothetical protein